MVVCWEGLDSYRGIRPYRQCFPSLAGNFRPRTSDGGMIPAAKEWEVPKEGGPETVLVLRNS